MTRELPEDAALLTDLYELTMAASFFQYGINEPACFTLSVRRMPPRRGFLVAAGLQRLLDILENFRFTRSALDYLDSLKIFAGDFLNFLSELRFSGELSAISEGSIFFAEEPIVEIRAPLIEAQIVETIALNQLGTACLLATKAARCYAAAAGRRLIDFGLRRSHGADAGLMAARCCYIAGFHGTSNLLAGDLYGIPVFGTMAHSYVMAHEREREAFENFVRTFPKLGTLLVDTYDTIRGVENAAAVARQLKQSGLTLQGIRLDSGDLLDLSRQARRILDRHDLREVAIFASGNLDEYVIRDLLRSGAPIDAFGVGTATVVSADAPSLDTIYKLGEYKGVGRLKTSAGKNSLPGHKQVFRAWNAAGSFYEDLIGLAEESPGTVMREFRPAPSRVTPLLAPVMKAGARTAPAESVADARERFLADFSRLDQRHKRLDRPETFPVRLTAALNAMVISEKLRIESRQR